MEVLTNACVLTKHGFRERQSVVIDAGYISAVMDDSDFDRQGVDTSDVDGHLLLPGFIDVQVNGGGGVLFNDAPTVDGIRSIGAAHRKFGTTGFLPTLISDDLETVATAIAATDQAIEEGIPGLLGIHIEGPFLSTKKKGVHDASKFRILDENAVDLLSSLQNGKTVVTLAPEIAAPELIRRMVDAGVIVAAGHSNASYDAVRVAIAAGLSGFTHLFNAMSPLTSREPGVVGAALDDEQSWCGMIVDGHHVHPATMRIALASKPRGRCLLVTDAMPSVGAANKSFELNGQLINVADGKCVTADGTLAGSDLDMAAAVKNATSMLRLDLAEAVRMASEYPAEVIGLGRELGRIQPGYRANLVLTDPDLNVIDTWINGESTA
jgi:N-acetylglucosamine-6-phosphate deacetylase